MNIVSFFAKCFTMYIFVFCIVGIMYLSLFVISEENNWKYYFKSMAMNATKTCSHCDTNTQLDHNHSMNYRSVHYRFAFVLHTKCFYCEGCIALGRKELVPNVNLREGPQEFISLAVINMEGTTLKRRTM